MYPHVLASLPTWLFTILVILVALLPDIVIRYNIVETDFIEKPNVKTAFRVLRKHWTAIQIDSHQLRQKMAKKLHKGSFQPNSSQAYLNPVFDEPDVSVVGQKMTTRKSSSTNSYC